MLCIALHNENESSKYIMVYLTTDTKNIYKIHRLFLLLSAKIYPHYRDKVYIHLYTMCCNRSQ